MSTGEHDPGHGNSVAAWTAVTIICLGFLIGAIAFPLQSPIVFWVGIVVALLGIVAGKVLAMMGFGVAAAAAAEHSAD